MAAAGEEGAYSYKGMSADNIKGLVLALSSSFFIGASFIVKKKGLKKAGASGIRAGMQYLVLVGFCFFCFVFFFFFLCILVCVFTNLLGFVDGIFCGVSVCVSPFWD